MVSPLWSRIAAPHTVRETATFAADAQRLLSESQREKIVDELAHNPMRGAIIPGTGGMRKLRFAASGKGKSGGVRVIYFHFDAGHPIYAIALFAKNEKADLSAGERDELKTMAGALKAAWRKKP